MKHLVIPLCWIVLSLIFLAAAIPKILDPHSFAVAIHRYQLLPEAWINAVAISLPWLELVAALALVSKRHRKAAAIILTALLLIFTAAILSGVLRGLDITCGCFTTDPQAHRIGWLNVLRNVILLALALASLFANGSPRVHKA
ncbi:MAG: DoxX family protein [Verrucomicrobia bacterium]|nr:DoxX family protein [Verrucomicrobiota bacterium]